jgi:hypothetical protein
MARMEISAVDIQPGLPPYCVYCGDATEDVKDFPLEDSPFWRHVSLPFCEEHVFAVNFVRCTFALGSLVGIGISIFLYRGGFLNPPLIALFPILLAFTRIGLDRYWYPRAIRRVWNEDIELRNIHPEFCYAILEQRAEGTDASD